MIIRARCVLTMDGAPIENGAVAVEGETITDVGDWNDLRRRHRGEIIDLGESILLPGLINAHCHLDYTNLRGRIPPQGSFADWIRAINEEKAQMDAEAFLRGIAAGIDESARFGTTTIANLAACPEVIASVPRTEMRIRWFVELLSVRGPVDAAETIARFADVPVELAPHAPYTADRALYAQTADVTRQHQLVATTHLAESREEMQMFRDASGPLYDLLKQVGRKMDDCNGRTPIAWLHEGRRILDERWIVTHLNEVTADDFEILGRGPKFHIVHCPRSHAFFGHCAFPFAKLRKFGFNISLGTDSLASNVDLSLFAEVRQFSRSNPQTTARELVEMVTTHPAVALHEQDCLGRIRRGYRADLIAIPFAEKVRDAFESVVEFSEEVGWRMVYGKVALPR